MKKNLESYVKKYSNFLDKKFCNETIKQIKNLNWEEHKFYISKTKTNINVSKHQELENLINPENKNTDVIMEKIWHVVKKYTEELKFPWFDSWNGYTRIRYNKYSFNKKMAEHCDHIHSMFDGNMKGIPTLSVLGILNNDFKGGEFIMFKNKKIELKQGDLLIFPSLFLYPHRVDPVTKGTRYSYISWVW
jgi:predicted 2-oxoglutarate/Fe(II)-dependent dioxygenase YbiX